MHAKVQGTALIAYLRGQFIQIAGVEGRTCLVREGRLGEVVAIDAGKMLLVKPTAKRLPDTVDVNLSNFIENSPMFNNGLKLAASSLIAQAIEKQSGNRYLKSTPIYLEGAGSEAGIAGGYPTGRDSVIKANRSTFLDWHRCYRANTEAGCRAAACPRAARSCGGGGGGLTTASEGVNGGRRRRGGRRRQSSGVNDSPGAPGGPQRGTVPKR